MHAESTGSSSPAWGSSPRSAIGTEADLAGSASRAAPASAPITLVRRLAALRRASPCEVKGFDPLRFDREEGRQEDRPLHPVRDRGRRDGDQGPGLRDRRRRRRAAGRASSSAPASAASRRSSASTPSCSKRGPAADQPVLHPRRRSSTWPRAGSRSAPGAKGPNSATCHRLHHRRPRDRRLVPPDPARRRRRDDRRRQPRRRSRRSASAASARCGRCRRATTSPRRPRGRSTADRDGFVIGEGAGIVVLEELEHARRARRDDLRRGRGLRHVGRRLPHLGPDRGRRRRRPRDAGHAHGRRRGAGRRSTTSTRTAPRRRSATRSRRSPRKTVFGEHARKLAISSTKSMTGHLLGAAGRPRGRDHGAGAATSSVMPPTINLENPDPECDLDYVPNQARRAELRYALSATRSASAARTARCCSEVRGLSRRLAGGPLEPRGRGSDVQCPPACGISE